MASESIVLVPVSADERISKKITQLIDLSKKSELKRFSAKDSALLFILNRAHNVIADGRLEFNAQELKNKFVDGLTGEIAKLWQLAFYQALLEAREQYLIPHPDSQ